MAFSKFIQWVDQCSEKISLLHVFLLSCLFTLMSVAIHHGGVLHPEMELRLPFYMSDMPLLNKLFDIDILEAGFYRARELSYVFDFIDSKFIELSIENGFPHFLSLTHYLFSIATGCLLWLFCVKELNLKPLIGICWLTLFWTSPSIFLGGDFFRSAKIVVTLLVAILFYVIYKVAVISKEGIDFQISKKVWILYCITIFLITFIDEQGLFFAITVLVFLTIWGFFVRHKNIYIMLLFSVSSVLLHGLYKHTIAPRLTFILNGYWPDFSYIPTMPIQYFFQNLGTYLSEGLFLYVETFRFLIGNPPLIVGYGLLVFFISVPFFYLYTNSDLSANYRKFFALTLVGLLITNFFLLIVMNALMVLKKPDLISFPDVKLGYYWLPTNVILVMTLAMLTDIFYKLRVPKWLVLTVMCVAVGGNIIALPKEKAIMMQGHLKQYYATSSALLNALKNLGSLNDVHERLIEENMVFQFFKSKKNNKAMGYSANVYSVRGGFYAERGQYQRSIENCNEAIRLKPDWPEAYNNRGNVYFKLGYYPLAITDFNEAIRLRPDLAEGYNNRGNFYFKLGNYQSAIIDFNEAIRLKSDWPEAYNNRGNVYFKLGYYPLAITDFNEAIRLRPDLAGTYNNRGNVYLKLGYYQLAIIDFNEAIRLKPDLIETYYNRGLAYLRHGHKELGCGDVQIACKFGECKAIEWARSNGYCR